MGFMCILPYRCTKRRERESLFRSKELKLNKEPKFTYLWCLSEDDLY